MTELTPDREIGGLSVAIQNGVGEAHIPVPDTFLALITNCQLVRLGDHVQSTVSRLSMKPIIVTAKHISEGQLTLGFVLGEPLRITVSDEGGRPLKKTQLLLVNTEQCHEFVTDEQGQVVVFEERDRYRIVVPDQLKAKVTVERL